MRYIVCLLAFLMISSSVSAAVLFPPQNSSGSSPCATNQVLQWTGNGLKCDTPTITNSSCSVGKVIAKISNGVATCVNPSPYITTSSCPSGKVMTSVNGGTAVCISSPLTAMCPSGQVLQGVSNGSPVCVAQSSGSSGGGCQPGYVMDPGGSGTCFPAGNFQPG